MIVLNACTVDLSIDRLQITVTNDREVRELLESLGLQLNEIKGVMMATKEEILSALAEIDAATNVQAEGLTTLSAGVSDIAASLTDIDGDITTLSNLVAAGGVDPNIAALVTSIKDRVSGSGAQLTAVSAAIKAQADFSKTVAARTDNPVPNPPPVVEPAPAPFA